jgi:uncharacterized protein (DUF433 family)
MGIDTLWPTDGQADDDVIKIIESDIGLLISESRASVYDVMEAHNEGYNPSEIGDIYNLSPHQVDVALAYIHENRAWLEPELQRLLVKKVENEAYYCTLIAEREKQFIREMTPERIKFNELLARSRGEM